MSRSKFFFFIVIALAVILVVVGIIYTIGTVMVAQIPGFGVKVPQSNATDFTNSNITYNKEPTKRTIDYDSGI